MSVGSMKSKFEKNMGQIHYKVDKTYGMSFFIHNRIPQIRYGEAAKALTVVLVECKVGTFSLECVLISALKGSSKNGHLWKS